LAIAKWISVRSIGKWLISARSDRFGGFWETCRGIDYSRKVSARADMCKGTYLTDRPLETDESVYTFAFRRYADILDPLRNQRVSWLQAERTSVRALPYTLR